MSVAENLVLGPPRFVSHRGMLDRAAIEASAATADGRVRDLSRLARCADAVVVGRQPAACRARPRAVRRPERARRRPADPRARRRRHRVHGSATAGGGRRRRRACCSSRPSSRRSSRLPHRICVIYRRPHRRRDAAPRRRPRTAGLADGRRGGVSDASTDRAPADARGRDRRRHGRAGAPAASRCDVPLAGLSTRVDRRRARAVRAAGRRPPAARRRRCSARCSTAASARRARGA